MNIIGEGGGAFKKAKDRGPGPPVDPTGFRTKPWWRPSEGLVKLLCFTVF